MLGCFAPEAGEAPAARNQSLAALYSAAAEGDVGTLRRLLRAGAPPDGGAAEGAATPLVSPHCPCLLLDHHMLCGLPRLVPQGYAPA